MSDLRGYNAPGRLDVGLTGRLIAAAVIVAAICGAGVYAYQTGMRKPPTKQAVSMNQLPSPTQPFTRD